MNVSIPVGSRAEAAALKAALEDPATRAITVMNGILLGLPSERARQRVLTWFIDAWTDQALETRASGSRDRMPLFRLHDADGTSGE